jgi:hypothetical protein
MNFDENEVSNILEVNISLMFLLYAFPENSIKSYDVMVNCYPRSSDLSASADF